MEDIKLVFFTRTGKKILIAPDIDTHFGAINHKWKLDEKGSEWTSFEPRLSLYEITLDKLTEYFEGNELPISNTENATLYIQEKKRLVFFDYGKKSSILKRAAQLRESGVFFVVIDERQRILDQETPPVIYKK